MIELQKNPASFRDPRGSIYHLDNKILRTVNKIAVDDFDYVRNTGFIDQLIHSKKLLPEEKVGKEILIDDQNVHYVLQHPKLTFVSYPYEWSFTALQKAALLQLDILLDALTHGVMLTDASAYNIQFQGAQPVFIDHLAFRRYQTGEIWPGHRQFCEQFLNPLLLQSCAGVAFNSNYRGAVTGITAAELKKLLPYHCRFLPKIFMHVVFQSSLQKTSSNDAAKILPKINLPLNALQKMLQGLWNWIADLKSHRSLNSEWKDYSVAVEDSLVKQALVKEFITAVQPGLVYDLGCNIGIYAKTCLAAGAKEVIGLDADPLVVDKAFQAAHDQKLNFFPTVMNLANPSPAQGWVGLEQQSFSQRANPDALLALALLHHLVIGKNIPLFQLIDWLLDLAPQGLIEFVPKTDARVQELLRLREDIFVDYSYENFLSYIGKRAEIIKEVKVADSGRMLVWYKNR